MGTQSFGTTKGQTSKKTNMHLRIITLICAPYLILARPRSDREMDTEDYDSEIKKNSKDFSTLLLNSSRGGDQKMSVEDLFNQYYGSVGNSRIKSTPSANSFYNRNNNNFDRENSRVKTYKMKTREDGSQEIVEENQFPNDQGLDMQMSKKSKTLNEAIKEKSSLNNKRRRSRKNKGRRRKSK